MCGNLAYATKKHLLYFSLIQNIQFITFISLFDTTNYLANHVLIFIINCLIWTRIYSSSSGHVCWRTASGEQIYWITCRVNCAWRYRIFKHVVFHKTTINIHNYDIQGCVHSEQNNTLILSAILIKLCYFLYSGAL